MKAILIQVSMILKVIEFTVPSVVMIAFIIWFMKGQKISFMMKM